MWLTKCSLFADRRRSKVVRGAVDHPKAAAPFRPDHSAALQIAAAGLAPRGEFGRYVDTERSRLRHVQTKSCRWS